MINVYLLGKINVVAGVYKTKEKMIKELTDEEFVETEYNDCYYLYKKELN